ncbi:arylamine N-acetyltransferase [Ruegeria sp. HKCCD8929]|uniref:arylamine N-acetyltransferase family protein n=1 Tax=Ruegeria sp. HKCCD8929 TaxID=2683006 RepID=UPI0014892CD0|nr:arylamine N-acetyltransferase [Ruegeria sp. HKCCD8929]
MQLDAYLKRIEYSQPLEPDRSTLDGLVKAQLRTIPFENLDQQMGVDVSTAVDRAYEKVVLRQSGGWCFELNGLFGWVLREIGFEVAVLAGHVGPDKPQPGETGDHMLLHVDCDGPLLVDVGFGGGPYQPVPLRPGTFSQPPYTISISNEGDGWYKYSELADGNESNYWFTLDKVETSHFETANRQLQSDPNSPFRRTLTAQRRVRNKHVVLRGLVKRTIDEAGTREVRLSSEQALVDCLKNDFNLDIPQIATCWPALIRRHEELFGT